MENSELIGLLKDVKVHILEHPETFDMSDWIQDKDGVKCGCIGGWSAMIAKGENIERNRFYDVWRNVLEIDLHPDDIWLFHIREWPSSEYSEYALASLEGDDYGRAKIAAKMIDEYIEELNHE